MGNVFQWYLLSYRRWRDFQGRSCRAEYWTFMIITCTVITGFFRDMLLDLPESSISFVILTVLVYLFAVIVPTLSLSIRRLHDMGVSGKWLILAFIGLAPLFFLLIGMPRSQPNWNEYEPIPILEDY